MRFSIGILSLVASLLLATPTLQAAEHLAMNQWVRADGSGNVVGRVVAASDNGHSSAVVGAAVVLINDAGQALRTQTNETGHFTVPAVAPGVYAFAARGANAIACCALHVIASDTANDTFPSTTEICAAKIDYSMIKSALVRYLPTNIDPLRVSIADADLESIAVRVCGIEHYRVAQSGGGLTGQLHLAGANGNGLIGAELMNVFVVGNGIEVARTVTDKNGKFKIDSLTPGHYSVLAIGQGGVGLVGFELVAAPKPTQSTGLVTTDGERLVMLQQATVLTQFQMQVAPPQIIEDVVIEERVIQDDEDDGGMNPFMGDGGGFVDGFGAPVPGGPGVGGGGVGGGGSGFGGSGAASSGRGLGGLAALGAIGAAVAIAASDDSQVVRAPAPISPLNP